MRTVLHLVVLFVGLIGCVAFKPFSGKWCERKICLYVHLLTSLMSLPPAQKSQAQGIFSPSLWSGKAWNGGLPEDSSPNLLLSSSVFLGLRGKKACLRKLKTG